MDLVAGTFLTAWNMVSFYFALFACPWLLAGLLAFSIVLISMLFGLRSRCIMRCRFSLGEAFPEIRVANFLGVIELGVLKRL